VLCSYNIDNITVIVDECDKAILKAFMQKLLFPSKDTRFRFIGLLSATHLGPGLQYLAHLDIPMRVHMVTDDALEASGYSLDAITLAPECDSLNNGDFSPASDPIDPEPVQQWLRRAAACEFDVLGLIIANDRHQGFTGIGRDISIMTPAEETEFRRTGVRPIIFFSEAPVADSVLALIDSCVVRCR
jgi:hypothetical protein